MSALRHILKSLLVLVAMLCLPSTIAAQAEHFIADTTQFVLADSLYRAVDHDLQLFSELSETSDSASSSSISGRALRRQLRQQRLATFTPDPAKATWSALVFPGGGQIYNHKYWKLPIVYGGFVGCAYALTWNGQMYEDYSQAYLDIMDDNPTTDSFMDLLPPGYPVEANKEYLKGVIKRKKDYYRRYRDMSMFIFVGVYALSIIDAYVDAELASFDIGKDLSMKLEPTVIQNNQYNLKQGNSYGLQCSFNF